MATASTNLSLIIPEATDATVVRTVYNTNWNTIDAIFNTVTLTEFGYLDGVTSAIQTQFAGKQPLDTGLTSIAALTTAANKSIYTTALDTYATYDLTAFARTILDDADEATFKATVNLEIGTDVLAYDAHIAAIAALAKTDSSLIVGNGTTWVLESGNTLRTSLGLAIGTNVQAYDASLSSIASLTYVSTSFIKLTAEDTYAVRTIAETKSDLSLNLVENTALSTWVGTTNITTLGTIATGVWSGTVIGAAKGGTGVANNAASTLTISGNFATTITVTEATGVTLPASGTLVNTAVATLSSLTSISTITTGGLGTGAVIGGVTMTLGSDADFDVYYRASNILTRLAPNTVASNKFLRMIGTGSAGQAPSWQALGTSDIPDISATYAVIAQTMYIGTTGVAINRGSAALTLAGITLTTPNIGTPSAGTLTSCTGLPIATGISGLAANVTTFLATPSSANLLAAVTDETGTGLLTFATSPTFTTQITTPIINLTGGQIAFPTTQAPSANANTLDDYEEGTWTPAISFGGGTTGITYHGSTAGLYTKIGNMVTVTGKTELTSKGTSTGNVLITGLPFTMKNVDGASSAVSLSLYLISYANAFMGAIHPNTNSIMLYELTEGGARTNLTAADFADTSQLYVTATYFTD